MPGLAIIAAAEAAPTFDTAIVTTLISVVSLLWVCSESIR